METFGSTRLCTNLTFWRDVPCPVRRCSGNWIGQCEINVRIDGRQERSLSFSEPCDDLKGSCRDKSEVICPEDYFNYDLNSTSCEQHFMHKCKTLPVCIHQDLVCDGLIHCPDGSDEDDGTCSQCPKPFGHPSQKILLATFSCKHRYTNRSICAVPCDGEDDLCMGFVDENCDLGSTIYIALIVGFFLIIVSITGELFFHFLKREPSTEINLEQINPIFKSSSRILLTSEHLRRHHQKYFLGKVRVKELLLY